jgi:hypothetical protein
MSENQIKIGASLDISKLDQQMSELQRKIKSIRETGPGGTYSQLAQQYRAQGDDQKAQRIEEFRNKQQAISRKELNNDLKQQEKTLQGLMRHYDNLQSGLSKLTEGTDRWIKKSKELKSTFEEINTTVSGINSGMSVAGQAGQPGQLGKLTFAGVAGAIAAVADYGNKLNKKVGTYPEKLAQREAEIASTVSEMNRLQMKGKGYEMSLFAPERMKALERASKRVEKEKTFDKVDLFKDIAAGAGAGAAFGSVVPIVGTATGTIIGGGVGFAKAMLDDRKRSMLFNQDAYQKELGSVFSSTYKEQLAAERAKSFEKDLAAQFFGRESGRFRGLQRQFGMSDEDLYLGGESLFRKNARAGYSMDTMTQAMQGISAAGGPTKVSIGGAGIAAQMQRNMDLTNAPQLLGKISGATGINEIQSKDSIIRMFTEGVRIGLDTSETRDFLQTAADTAYRTGGGLEAITGLLSAGVQGTGLQSTRGIEAAQNALERIKQQTSEMGGLTGQYGIAGLQDKEITNLLGGKSLSIGETGYLLGNDISKITDEYIQALLEGRELEAGPEQIKALKEEIIKKKTSAILQTSEQEESLKEYQKMQENPGAYTDKQRRAIEKRANEAMGLSQQGFLNLENPEKKASLGVTSMALTGKVTSDLTPGEIAASEEKYKTDRKRAVDEAEKSAAMDAAGSLNNLREKAEALVIAFQANVTAGENAAKAAQGLSNLATILGEIKDPKELEKIKGFLNKNLEKENVDTNNMGAPGSGENN